MSRSAILSGKPVPRSRAHQRHRHDRVAIENQSARKGVEDWLALHISATDFTFRQFQSLDLGNYLQSTSLYDLAPGERLRLLAAYLDNHAGWNTGETYPAWLAFQRIYQLAKKLDPANVWIWISDALTTVHLQELLERSDPHHVLLEKHSNQVCLHAQQTWPEESEVWYISGYVRYQEQPIPTAEALRCFERACQLDSTNAWAHLYRAHCLQDSEQWEAAAEAYHMINNDVFSGHRAWRGHMANEQRAYCLLKAGHTELALQLFTACLERREHAVACGLTSFTSPVLFLYPIHLEEVAKGVFHSQLYDRFESYEQAEKENLGEP
jgi:tetratricopeptide (TPR) repeat protein